MFQFIMNNYSEYDSYFFKYFPKLFIPFMNSEKIYVQDIVYEAPKPKKRPNLTIDTNIDDSIVNYNYKKALSKSSGISNNVEYFRCYLKHFYSCEKSEEEIERILKTIKNIRNSVKKDFPIFS